MREGNQATGSHHPAPHPVERHSLRILHVNTSDLGGGAERSATSLAAGCRAAGHRAWVAVGKRRGDDPHTLLIPNEPAAAWSRSMLRLSDLLKPAARKIKPLKRARRWLERLTPPATYLNELRGRENFHYPGTRRLLQLPPEPPDVVHAHNLHGGYFDLRRLAPLSRQVPVVVTLRDEWLLTGHCAYTGDCTRWRTGCGACPDLSIYPAIRRDGTAENWKAKEAIYQDSRLFLAAPSRWLLAEAKRSMLAEGMVEGRVIPNGVDTRLFRPVERSEARDVLNLPRDRPILLGAANRIRSNRFKDWSALRAAMEIVGASIGSEILFIALGEAGEPEKVGRVEIRFVPFERDMSRVAAHFQAADVFLHAARSEAAGRTILESLACATPVIATAVGGIPEQIRDLADPSVGEAATGVLVPAGDAVATARWIETLLGDPGLRARLGERARADAQARFSTERTVSAYLSYYEDALAAFARRGTFAA